LQPLGFEPISVTLGVGEMHEASAEAAHDMFVDLFRIGLFSKPCEIPARIEANLPVINLFHCRSDPTLSNLEHRKLVGIAEFEAIKKIPTA
jgi:hypothetical protein